MKNLTKLKFGDRTQMNYIDGFREPELIADKKKRDDSEAYLHRKMPEIMTRKNFNHEPLEWTCPVCGTYNKIKGWTYHHEHQYTMMNPIITPRTYTCHNSQCFVRRFYYRDTSNNLYAQFVGKYQEINELDFKSRHDPLKFYNDLPATPIDPKQQKLF